MLGPVQKGKFGESPSYVVTHPIAATCGGSWPSGILCWRHGSSEASSTAGRDIWLGLLEAAGGVGRLKLGAASSRPVRTSPLVGSRLWSHDNIINGGLECGRGPDSRVEDRIGFYKRYCDMLGVGYGNNLDCNNQRPFA
ncbi:hypothetical protein F3Y22_tig00117034pilonHSYRG00450 [Hibiscus syriacus]|uniref:Glycoside hydrolase family 19 catalytic domain-containing protein n=1 Tax=Hibiscus syriacus TaxID=106335 RepID=A0A6A2WG75_HIBSY|nr:hypothetical protein F3Y22_tig00117034pilonHSYRG00450 [Hibiscus syriacus]